MSYAFCWNLFFGFRCVVFICCMNNSTKIAEKSSFMFFCFYKILFCCFGPLFSFSSGVASAAHDALFLLFYLIIINPFLFEQKRRYFTHKTVFPFFHFALQCRTSSRSLNKIEYHAQGAVQQKPSKSTEMPAKSHQNNKLHDFTLYWKRI